jgi:limonene-1,2-epoxide hydrolase
LTDAQTNERFVRAFFATWNVSFDAMIEGFKTHLAPDCLLKQTGTPDLHGLDEIIPFLNHVRKEGLMEKIAVEVSNIVATDTSVAAERLDIMYAPGGDIVARFPCVSVMDIANGKIAGWRDYFDSADMPAGGMDTVNKPEAARPV